MHATSTRSRQPLELADTNGYSAKAMLHLRNSDRTLFSDKWLHHLLAAGQNSPH